MVSFKQIIVSLAIAASANSQAVPYSSNCQTATTGQLCYAINVPNDSANAKNLFISITGPSTVGYAGLGFGQYMAGSLFFIATPQSGNNVTLSVRTASSEVMPTAYTATSITTEILDGTKNSGGMFQVNFKCVGCRQWSTGTLDTTSTAANLIWSTGNLASGANSSDPAARILYHNNNNGNFNMNLVSATGAAGIPGGSALSSTSGTAVTSAPASGATSGFATNAGSSTTMTRESRTGLWWSHAALMAIGWILIIGLGAVVVRFIPSALSVRVHYSLQLFGVVLIIVGAALGIKGSEDSHFKYAHQTFGVVIFALMFVQAAGGALHHAYFLRQKRAGVVHPSKAMALMHRYLGRALIVSAMVNVGLAFRMPMVALGKASQIAWYVVMGVVVLVYTILNFVLKTGSNEEREVVDHKVGREKGPESLGSSN